LDKPLIFAMPGNEAMASALCGQLGAGRGQWEVRRFPDGESYIRFDTPPQGRSIAIVCSLDQPDDKLVALFLAARIARDLGARRIGLVAPYLAYMRQDAVFKAGEGITAKYMGQLLGSCVDWMVTVDPHLHRIHDLGEVYPIATAVVHAAPSISAWIRANVDKPVVIGPDEESAQWAAAVAEGAGCPHTVLRKVRHGDHDVEVSVPDTQHWAGHTPVLVDDIASTAKTMIAAVGHLKRAGLPAPVCIAVHPLFAGSAYEDLKASGVARVVGCNTVQHDSVAIDLSPALARALPRFFA
jgi:ribose-phosphate pyrophosphokinase